MRSSQHAHSNTPQKFIAEYKQTFVLRMLTGIFVAPFGIGFVQVSGLSGESIVWLLIGSLLLLLTALVWINGFIFRVLLYQNGMVRKNIFGHRFVVINDKTRFYHKNVQEYVNGITAGKHIYLTVDDGKNKIKLNSNVKNISQLQNELFELEASYVYPAMHKAYVNGATADFGAIKLRGGCLLYKNKTVTLSSIVKMSLENGKFKIKVVDKMLAFCNVPVSELANMATFFHLIEGATDKYADPAVPAADIADSTTTRNDINHLSETSPVNEQWKPIQKHLPDVSCKPISSPTLVAISCPYCGYSKSLPKENIPRNAINVTCPKCRQAFPFAQQIHVANAAADGGIRNPQPISAITDVKEAKPPGSMGEGLAPPEVQSIPLWVKGMVAVGLAFFVIQLTDFRTSLSDAIIKNRASEASKAGRHADAVKLYQDLRSRYPNDNELVKMLAFSQYRNGQYVPALKSFDLLVGVKLPKSEVEKINAAINDMDSKMK